MNKYKIFLLLGILLTANIALFSKIVEVKVYDKDLELALEGVKINIPQLEQIFFTDLDGMVKFPVDDSVLRLSITCSLIGYSSKKAIIKDFDRVTELGMSIDGVMESEELVVEEEYYAKQDSVGTSMVVDKEELKNQAMKGTVEDVMSSIKSLPGIGYSSSFYTQLSVRGSNPDEVAASYDGFLVRYPYYWGNSHSIFNPNIVEAVKFNNGIFSVRNGMAMSGLIEVMTKTPDQGFRVYSKLGVSTFETYVQTPLGTLNSGLLFGGRITYLETTMGLAWKLMGVDVPRVPYIYNGDLKWFWKPHEKMEWYVNGFIGADGIIMGSNSLKSEGIESENYIDYSVLHAIGVTGFKILPNDKFFIHCFAGYEHLSSHYDSYQKDKGTKEYSQQFKDMYDPTGDRYGDTFKTNVENKGQGINLLHSYQTRVDVDVTLTDYIMLSFGGGLIYDFENNVNKFSYLNPNDSYKVRSDTTDHGNFNQFNTSLYLNFEFNPVPDILKIETGVRMDHFGAFLTGGSSINTYPSAAPRLFVSYTPVRNLAAMDYFTISLGSGLFTKFPDIYFDKDEALPGINNVGQEYSLNNVIGFEWMFAHGFKVKLEGYYKYYFNRYYINTENDKYKYHSDGTGHVAGFDLLLKRKISRYIDGWISYSFVFARYYNPQTNGADYSNNGEPLGIWYYPDYHRWHSMNIVLNVKPTTWFTISTEFGVHSGLPKKEFGEVKPIHPLYTNGQELYERERRYSDTLRTGVSLPLDIRFDFHFYIPKTQVRMEIYAAVDNIFSFFWQPDRRETLDVYTGDVVLENSAAYEVIVPSFGVKISY